MSGLVYRNAPGACGTFLALALVLVLSAPLSAYTTPFPSDPGQPAPQSASEIPPHLGYGANLRDPAHIESLFAPLGFEWIKLYEQYNALPTQRLPYHVLYRIDVHRDDRWSGSPLRPNLAKIASDIRQIAQNGLGRVEAYEIGNEPNTDLQWEGQPPDPADYVAVLQTAYTAIKAVDPNAIVVSAGLAPVGRIKNVGGQPCRANSGNAYDGNNCQAMDEREYARQMFNRGAGAYLDAFGYHPQGFHYETERALDQLPPDDNGNGFAFRGLEVMHGILQEYGLGDRPIWATEFGWLRDPAEDPSYTEHIPSLCRTDYALGFQGQYGWQVVTEAQQADFLRRAFAYADANWPWMGVMFVWNLDWHNQGWLCDSIRYFSVRQDNNTDDGLPALAYAALRDMPRRSAWTGPSMTVTPDGLFLVGAREDPRTLTTTVSIARGGASPVTWTASFDPPAPTGLTISPTTGTAPGSLTVSADASLFTITGTLHTTGSLSLPASYTFTLHITADPTTTVGSPFTLPVTLRVLDHWYRVYLPLVQKNSTGGPTPPPTPTPTATASPTPTPTPGPITTTTRFGAAFITSAEAPSDDARFQKSVDTGAGMDRWPLYWQAVEQNPGSFAWNDKPHEVDRAVIGDVTHGLQPLVILMNTPSFYATGGNRFAPMPRVGETLQMRSAGIGVQSISSVSAAGSAPVRLYESVFTDGTDIPGSAKTINPNNPWARFVYQAVSRYKPGGVLAQQQGWTASQGVRHWEIWNEEDYSGFWIGTYSEYARLLKVAYLAARHADPQAKIIFGGLANIDPESTWLKDTLSVINTYPDKDANNWFFDSVAEHNYVRAWGTFNYLYKAWGTLNSYTVTNKTLWVTESNVWSCDDGPITPPCFHDDGSPVELRANLEEQAAFVVQSATYATWINTLMPVETVFHFQMYDDCNDPIPGTTWGGGLGLMRNPTTSPCFNTWLPNTPRPAYAAFQSVTRNLTDVTPKWRKRPTPNQELFAFYRLSTQERVLAMWARGYVTETAVISATSTSAQLTWYNGSQTIMPTGGVYTITLPAATNNAFNDLSAPIGGRPYFLIESDPSGTGGQ